MGDSDWGDQPLYTNDSVCWHAQGDQCEWTGAPACVANTKTSFKPLGAEQNCRQKKTTLLPPSPSAVDASRAEREGGPPPLSPPAQPAFPIWHTTLERRIQDATFSFPLHSRGICLGATKSDCRVESCAWTYRSFSQDLFDGSARAAAPKSRSICADASPLPFHGRESWHVASPEPRWAPLPYGKRSPWQQGSCSQACEGIVVLTAVHPPQPHLDLAQIQMPMLQEKWPWRMQENPCSCPLPSSSPPP
jgi:hypothetical protein